MRARSTGSTCCVHCPGYRCSLSTFGERVGLERSEKPRILMLASQAAHPVAFRPLFCLQHPEKLCNSATTTRSCVVRGYSERSAADRADRALRVALKLVFAVDLMLTATRKLGTGDSARPTQRAPVCRVTSLGLLAVDCDEAQRDSALAVQRRANSSSRSWTIGQWS
jgi:hypothetical protein